MPTFGTDAITLAIGVGPIDVGCHVKFYLELLGKRKGDCVNGLLYVSYFGAP